MTRAHKHLFRITAFCLTPTLALAHPGNGEHDSLMAGAMHPMSGIDHLAAFIVVGILAAQLGGRTFWSMTAAFLGFLFVEMKAPSVMRRTRSFLFGLFGAICGLIASVVYGVFGIKEAACDTGYCGWSVLGLVLGSFWPSLGLLAAVGVILGVVGGVTAAWLTRGRQAGTVGEDLDRLEPA